MMDEIKHNIYEGGAGMVQGAPRPSWWLAVTVKFGQGKMAYGGDRFIEVELVLPNGKTKHVGVLHQNTTLAEVQRMAGEKFKEFWDPVNRCER